MAISGKTSRGGTLTARQWEEEMRAGDFKYMSFAGLVFNHSVCIAAVRPAHGYSANTSIKIYGR
jgi:hypothetical protein